MEGIKSEYPFKTEKIEKALSFIGLLLFVLTFIYKKNTVIMVVFYLYVSIILLYYIIWFRKKPPYIEFTDEEIIIREGLFFRRKVVRKGQIADIKQKGSALEISLGSGKSNIVKIYSFLTGGYELTEISKKIAEYQKQ